MNRYKKTVFILIAVLAFGGLSSLSAQPVAETGPVKIGIMPDVDSLPFMVADSLGLFEDSGAAVELVRFQSPVERDAAFQSGQIDGMVGDTLGAFFLEQSGTDISIVSMTNGRYGIAGEPGGSVTDLSQLAGKQVGISSNTIIEYLAEDLVVSAGVDASEFESIAIPKIPVRMEMVLSGQIPAACLPEPLYTLMVSKGAVPLGDSTTLAEAPGIMIFSAAYVEAHKEQLAATFRAYWDACRQINADNDRFRPFLVSDVGFDPSVAPIFDFVTYTKPAVPTEAQVMQVADWMVGHDLLDSVPSYEDMVDPSVTRDL
jgi:NitT/TauT family transport system substrate-binding protein